MINILWIIVILLAAVSQWYIIEFRQREPNHLIWFLSRAGTFGGFLWWYLANGFMWYWASFFMIMTFAWLFPLWLNMFRGKPIGYMSNKGFDKLILRTIGAGIYFWLGLVLVVMAVALQLVYGQTEFRSI